MSTEYPEGSQVSYMDDSATVSDDSLVMVTGTVNGPCLRDEDGDITHVPVFSQRDNGREPTTVYVNIKNIMEAE